MTVSTRCRHQAHRSAALHPTRRSTRTRWIAAVLCSAITLSACQSPSEPNGAPASAPSPSFDNVLVILIDALRADHLGAYGYEQATSPELDALGKRSATFLQAVSTAPWTLPAMASMWTSLYPSVHGASRPSSPQALRSSGSKFQPANVLDESHTTLAETLGAAGFATAAFIDGAYPSLRFGTPQGFAHVVEDEADGSRLNFEAVLQWLDDKQPKRFFAYVHLGEVHSPYTGPYLNRHWLIGDAERKEYARTAQLIERKRYNDLHFDPEYEGEIDGSRKTVGTLAKSRKRLRPRDLKHLVACYDTGIAYVDGWIGDLLERLDQRALTERTLVIVTSDHGDEFLDHGGYEHSFTFYEEMLRVPLIIHAPGIGTPRRIDRQVGLIDVMPTILELTGVQPTSPMQGVSLVPLIAGEDIEARILFAESSMSRTWVAAGRSETEKFIQAHNRKRNQLYDLREDPAERKNLCRSDPARCRQWMARMRAWRAGNRDLRQRLATAPAQPAVIDADTRERLRALGYDE